MTTYGDHGWRVHPAGVRKVAHDTRAAGRQIGLALKPLPDQLAGASAAAEGTGGGPAVIEAAVVALSDALASKISAVEQRLPAAVDGAVRATTAVVEGDEQMAAEVQRAASAAGRESAPSVEALPGRRGQR